MKLSNAQREVLRVLVHENAYLVRKLESPGWQMKLVAYNMRLSGRRVFYVREATVSALARAGYVTVFCEGKPSPDVSVNGFRNVYLTPAGNTVGMEEQEKKNAATK